MIKINLSPDVKKKQGILLLKLVNFRMILVMFVVFMSVDLIDLFYFKPIQTNLQSTLDTKNAQLKKILDEFKSHETIKTMLEAYNVQVEKLKEREKQVTEVLNMRKNPYRPFIEVAKAVEGDTWLEKIVLDEQGISFKGKSASYKSIILFLDSLNESIYFNGSLKLKDYRTVEEDRQGVKVRVEDFEIIGRIMRYE